MHWSIVWDYRSYLLEGLVLTVQISASAALIAFILAIILTFVRQSPNYLVRQLIASYIEVVRNIPSVVKIFAAYYIFSLSAFEAGVAALAIHQSAYLCDVLEAGFRSVPREQSEAAWACGHSRLQIFAFVSLPQVAAAIVPPLTTQLIEIVKNSAAAMLIGVQELTFQTQRISLDTFRGFEAATIVTLIYAALAFAVVVAMSALERRIRWR